MHPKPRPPTTEYILTYRTLVIDPAILTRKGLDVRNVTFEDGKLMIGYAFAEDDLFNEKVIETLKCQFGETTVERVIEELTFKLNQKLIFGLLADA